MHFVRRFSRIGSISVLAIGLACASREPSPSTFPPIPSAAATNLRVQDPGPPSGTADEPPRHSHGVFHRVLFWIPNRVFDILDLVRLRLRAGPGFTLSARVTEMVDINMGTHSVVYVGLCGPRGWPRIPWPFGFEKFSGLEISAIDKTTESERSGPNYGMLEVGVGTQLLIIGFDLGIDIGEIGDFFAGILLFDPIGDDL